MKQKINKKVVLVVNLGSPNKLKTHSIREFLRIFLSDKRVVNLPRFIWYPILYGIILPIRSKKLLKQYAKIWLNGESPLIYYTRSIAQKLQNKYDDNTIVCHAFSYSEPSIQQQLDNIGKEYHITDLTVLPLYPQFSSTTTMSVFDQINNYYKNKYHLPSLKFINQFYNHEAYINVIANEINTNKLNGNNHILFSYHSLPVVIINKGDTYYDECIATTKKIAEKLGVTDYSISFQSRFGSQKWLTPSTVSTVKNLANKQNINVVCPGFVCDCLETLEEIALINQEVFVSNGGKSFNYIKCINDSDSFIDVLYEIIN